VSTGGYGKQADISLSHHNVDPSNTKAMITALAGATVAAMSHLDPDGDGDVDGVNDDDDSCPSCGGDLPADANYCPACGQHTETAEQPPGVEESETTVSETTPPATTTATETTPPATPPAAPPATETAPARNFTDADIAALAAALKPATETAPATGTVTETAEQKAEREKTEAREALRLEVRAELIEEARKDGIARKGLVRDGKANESFDLAELPKADRDQMFKDSLVGLLAPQFATQTD